MAGRSKAGMRLEKFILKVCRLTSQQRLAEGTIYNYTETTEIIETERLPLCVTNEWYGGEVIAQHIKFIASIRCRCLKLTRPSQSPMVVAGCLSAILWCGSATQD